MIKRLFGGGRSNDEIHAPAPATTALPLPEPFYLLLWKGLDSFASLTRRHGRALPTGAYSTLRRIDDILRPMVTYVQEHEIDMSFQVQMENMVLDMLPNTINTFASLDDSVRADQEAQGLLEEQCLILETRAAKLVQETKDDALMKMKVHATYVRQAL